ncbi:MAG TPA: S41 family peptidase [Bryobacteraceae bacterium]|nr:S41 family peptidase [Bryobacteraceae bacterium]
MSLTTTFRLSVILALLFAISASADMTPKERETELSSFELVWSTVRDHNPDPQFHGLDWQAIHDSYRTRIEAAKSVSDVREILREMIGKLGISHYAIVSDERYQAAPAPSSEGSIVQFGNLPESRLVFESRMLSGGVGYIQFNEFLDPVTIMPKFEAAMRQFAGAPGVILDLRGNPGGIGIMAMGIAGFFVSQNGQQLGTMKMRDNTLKFNIYPRPEVYRGKLAILLDGGSASTTEILAQGLQDLKRARIFGTRSMGAALPSDIIRLPNGDGFQYPTASFTSVGGHVLEGNGVTPDVEVEAAGGSDAVIDAAAAWIARP